MFIVVLLCSFAFVLSALLTHFYRPVAHSLGIIDEPNQRSSHKIAIPRGAGIAFFLSVNITLGLLLWFGKISLTYSLPVLLGGPCVMIMGYWDDLRSVNPLLRLFIHFLVSVFIFTLISRGFTTTVSISFLPNWHWLTAAFCVLFIAWFINLYNFMDGCDGLACGLGMVGAGLVALISYMHGSKDLAIVYLVISYSLAGFLIFNWSPAKVFMGDCGAYFLGYVFGSLALISKLYYDSSLYVHLIIFGMLIMDATWTLLRRLFRLEKLYEAHRLHGFQKLMDKGWGHARISSLYILITVLWLFPMAIFSMNYSGLSFLFLVVAYVPLLAMMLFIGAGSINR